jgi:CzcA family heavy metal efflux pump
MMLNRLISFSLRRRALVLAAAAVICALGLYSALTLPVDVLPNLNRPTVSVMAEAPGLQPEDVERQVAVPIEAALSGATGSATVRSVSGNGFALIHVEFGWSSDVYRNRQVVQERLDQLGGALPAGVKPAMLADASIMGEILLIGLAPATSDDEHLMELRAFADWTLRPKIMSLPGVANVSVIGGRRRQCQVLADPQAMRDGGVSLAELKEALQQADSRGAGGALIEADREIAVETFGRATSADAIAAAVIKMNENVPVRVGDVAPVRIGPEAPRGDAALNGKPALILAIQKQAGADTRAVTAEVDRALDPLRGSVPAGARMETQLFRQADFIGTGVRNVSESLGVGAGLAAVILLLFLFRIRPALVTLAAVPVSLFGTALVFKLFGQSINCMTLGGIAIGVGELADDAIVDVENVQRRLAENNARARPLTILESVFAASVEVRSAIIYGTAMVLLALGPLFFLPGLDGRLFTPLAAAYITSIFVSMFVALTLTPALASLLLKNTRAQTESPLLRTSKSVARKFYDLTLPRPGAVLALLLLSLGVAAAVASGLGRDYLPPFNETTLTIQLKAWPEISLAESNRLATQVEELLLSVPEVRATGRRTGRTELDEHAEGLHSSEIDVTFWNASGEATAGERARPAALRPRETVLREIQEKLRDLPALAVSIGQPIGHRIEHLLSGVRAPVVIKIRGDDLETLRRISSRVDTALRSVSGVTQIQIERPSRVPRVRPRFNSDALANSGFTSTGLAEYIQTMLNGQVISRGSAARRSPELLLWSTDEARKSVDSLRELPLVASNGAYVRLADVAEFVDSEGPAEIRRENGARKVTVACAVEGRDLGSAIGDMQRAVASAVTLPPGYTLDFGGEFEGRRAATRTLIPSALCALIVAALLLFGHFRSGAAVLLVLLNIPFAFVGGIAALALAHESLSLASLIGFITLAGISGRNGVLLVSHYIHLIRVEGLPFNRETVVRGSQERVAPVLMTALTTGLALIPLIIRRGQPGQELLHPMALVVVGGLISTTLLDFAVTPALFLKFFRFNPAQRSEPAASFTAPAERPAVEQTKS